MESIKNPSTVFVDTESIQDPMDFCLMIYRLGKLNIKEGTQFQFEGNGWGIFLKYQDYEQCKHVLNRFKVKVRLP